MEPSPLTRQLPPEVFQPKVVHLYESLFKVKNVLAGLESKIFSLALEPPTRFPYRAVAPTVPYDLELSMV
jgi:hypothetical protein